MKYIKDYFKKLAVFFKGGNEHDYDRDIMNVVQKRIKPIVLHDENYGRLSRHFYLGLYMMIFSIELTIASVGVFSIVCNLIFVVYFTHTLMSFVQRRRIPSFMAFFHDKTFLQRFATAWGIVVLITFLVMLCHFSILPQELADSVAATFSKLYLFAFLVLPIAFAVVGASASCSQLYKGLKKD